MQSQINQFVVELENDLINMRRDFHRFPELGWHEIRTASLIAAELAAAGVEFKLGREVFKEDDRMGLPSQAEMDANYERALDQGANREYAPLLKDGFTGIVATIGEGDGPGIALRFDIDALPISESDENDHFPQANHFRSQNDGVMHSCGHDGHGAIGVAVCRTLKQFESELKGPVKIFFQPAEEGVRGAKAMANSGELENIDYLLTGHIAFKATENGHLIVSTDGFLATSKLDAVFTGKSAHAGAAPQDGKNAMLAAATAILNLHAIPRHAGGFSQINVGKMTAGTMRNGICADATLLIETRGYNSEINEYMEEKAQRILKAAADMYDCEVDISFAGSAASGDSDAEIAEIARTVAAGIPEYTSIGEDPNFNGSEDATFLMSKVQEQGGKAGYMMFGSKIAENHHHPRFDFVESEMIHAVKLVAGMALRISNQ